MAAQSDCTANWASPENCASPTSLKDQLFLDIEAHRKLFESTARVGRKVCFEHDRTTNEIYKEYYESDLYLTEEEMGRMWWSRDELQFIYQDVRAMASYYRKHPSDYTSKFDHLFSKCAESSGRRLREFGLVHKPNQRRCRGLELLVHEILPRHRRRYVHSILKIQSKMTVEINPELRVKLLCAKSLHLSKPSRNLARFIAYQDYAEVAAIIREELGSSFATL
jgi:hypothetical protein